MVKSKMTESTRAVATAFLCSFIWVSATSGLYQYNRTILTLGQSAVYPALSWFIGLIALYRISLHIEQVMMNKKIAFFTICIAYWCILLSLEYGAYHVAGIRNLGTSMYDGLPFCDCLHAPWWMQMGYLLMGPAFLTLLRIQKKIFTADR